jgi:hypothetical protein
MPLAQIQFDWSITFGTVIHLASLLIGGTILYMKMVHRMEITEKRVARLYIWTRELMRVTPGVNPVVIATNGEQESD